jgi:DNA-directed RNA polymerase specialized sigma24 family protein
MIRARPARVTIDAVVRAQLLRRRTELRDLADEDLMALVCDGDARAFEIVFDRHAGPAFSLAYRICGRRGMAEEVVQEAFLSLWRSGARYDRTRGSVRSWALGVVHNRSIDAVRRHTSRDARNVADDVPGNMNVVSAVLVTPERLGGSPIPTHAAVIIAKLA